eukprot:CAMPEP_0172552350 /NCGR_PEP_ID=MMETSP1067-20121228/44387_1 /TAXON_ID=265564 ORGANISM="Thalassiosira punctigera, Strain Tpunct2005C2" /NCGR_SAMPLE_ID=MMETSP1067 /ASSEMBLY_ACC=CAM_ASM_000444 /LENGTH=222 /DNA_ID=CAMNT_0013340313 /DNA_START=149 /DNA_END=817 /DNA_ORIENTATION=+
MAQVAQFAPQAASLFNNMKTPASIIAGAMVPLGLLAPIPLAHPDGKPEHRLEKMMRRSYTAVAVLALLSEFISVIMATVAVNQLTETVVAPAASVWDLLQRDYDLSWSGTNAHFLFGMFSFAYLVAVRSYFNVGGGLLGRGVAGLAGSSLLYMVAVVNRGVASGSGDGLSYGNSIVSLFRHYAGLVLARKRGGFRPLELGAVALGFGSLVAVALAVFRRGDE